MIDTQKLREKWKYPSALFRVEAGATTHSTEGLRDLYKVLDEVDRLQDEVDRLQEAAKKAEGSPEAHPASGAVAREPLVETVKAFK